MTDKTPPRLEFNGVNTLLNIRDQTKNGFDKKTAANPRKMYTVRLGLIKRDIV